MADVSAISQLEDKINYKFKDRELARCALLAPGAEDDMYDGNRNLAQLGQSMFGAMLENIAFREKVVSRAEANLIIQNWSATGHCAELAKALEIGNYMKICIRQQGKPLSKGTLSLRLKAVIGAVWIDCKNNFERLEGAIRSMSLVPAWNARLPASSQPNDQGGSTKKDLPTASSSDPFDELQSPQCEFFNAAYMSPSETSSNRGNETEGFAGQSVCGDIVFSLSSGDFFSSSHSSSGDTEQLLEISATPTGSPTPATTRLSIVAEDAWNNDRCTKRPRREDASIESIPSAYKDYIEKEYSRHAGFNFPWTQEFEGFKRATSSHQDLAGLTLKADRLYLALGNPEAVATMRIILLARLEINNTLLLSHSEISMRARFDLIQHLDENASLLRFLKRYHTYALYVQCKGKNRYTADTFIVQTSYDYVNGAPKDRGNPVFTDKSKLNRLMMTEIFPDASSQDTEYEERYNQVTRLRQLGKRLDVLVEKFHVGILLLIPDHHFHRILNITDTLMLSISEKAFQKIVDLIDNFLGPFLRALSKSANVLIPFIHSDSAPTGQTLRYMDQQQILDAPRASRKLESLLTAMIDIPSS